MVAQYLVAGIELDEERLVIRVRQTVMKVSENPGDDWRLGVNRETHGQTGRSWGYVRKAH